MAQKIHRARFIAYSIHGSSCDFGVCDFATSRPIDCLDTTTRSHTNVFEANESRRNDASGGSSQKSDND